MLRVPFRSIACHTPRTDVFPQCQDKEEKQLIELYENEVNNLGQGGNLGAASDMLRWLSPIYRLGTYTDCDTTVDTSQLPETISVDKPLLLSLGSCILYNNLETMLVNNDMIAIPDSKAALPDIRKIQHMIIESCSRQQQDFNDLPAFKSLMKQFEAYAGNDHLISILSQDPEYQHRKTLLPIQCGKTIRELRDSLLKSTGTNSAYCQFQWESSPILAISVPPKESDWIAIQARVFREMTQTQLQSNTLTESQRADLKATLLQSDEETFAKFRLKHRFLLLKASVVYSSGPGMMAESLWDKVLFTAEELKDIKPYSFSNYPGLGECFKSLFPFHSTPDKISADLQGVQIGEISDVSWLNEGETTVLEREKELRNTLSNHLSQGFLDIHHRIEMHLTKLKQSLSTAFYPRHKQEKIDFLAQLVKQLDGHYFNLQGVRDTMTAFLAKDSAQHLGNTKIADYINDLTLLIQRAQWADLMDEQGLFTLSKSMPSSLTPH